MHFSNYDTGKLKIGNKIEPFKTKENKIVLKLKDGVIPYSDTHLNRFFHLYLRTTNKINCDTKESVSVN